MAHDATRVLPPGTYFLGDPANILGQHDLQLLRSALPDGYATTGVGLCTVRGHIIGVLHGHGGPGNYRAAGVNFDQTLHSHSGDLALVPKPLWDQVRLREAVPVLQSETGFQARHSTDSLRLSGALRHAGEVISPLVIRYAGPGAFLAEGP